MCFQVYSVQMLGYGVVIVYNEDGKDEIIKMGGGNKYYRLTIFLIDFILFFFDIVLFYN